MKHSKTYIGCENAASATAKVVSKSTYSSKYDTTTYYGSWTAAVIAAREAEERVSRAKLALHSYEVYRKVGNKWVEVEF